MADEPKRKPGRPTKYKPEYGELAIERMGKEGRALVELADEIGVTVQTVLNWEKNHPEFFEALTRARESSEAFWHNRVRELMVHKDVNSPLVKLYLANRFGWSDKQDVTSGGAPLPASIDVKLVKPSTDGD